MNCPNCKQPIPAALIRKAANAEAASHKRPGALGLVRNPKGRPRKERTCKPSPPQSA